MSEIQGDEPYTDASVSASPAADGVKGSAQTLSDENIRLIAQVVGVATPSRVWSRLNALLDAARADGAVARIMTMTDDELMTEPGAEEAAEEVGRTTARAIATFDIGEVRRKLQAIYDDASHDPGIRNFCGLQAEMLAGALATLSAGQSLTSKSEDGSSPLIKGGHSHEG